MVDIQPTTATTTQPISDDQELAQVLAGVTQQTVDDTALQFEETPAPTTQEPTVAADVNPQPATDDSSLVAPDAYAAPAGDDLAPIKSEAINELRPLVDKLNLPPEEKFDTYLLLLRSTDDRSLIAPAHIAAQAITDETKKAQALLDIIKEIDYLSSGANAGQPTV